MQTREPVILSLDQAGHSILRSSDGCMGGTFRNRHAALQEVEDAMLPLIKRRLTGQIAGLVGAFGNVGGVLFLTLYSFVTPQTFFLAASATAFIACGLIYMFVENPKGHMAEAIPDGTVTMIEVA